MSSNKQIGFTLTEVLVTLAITSLATLSLFQSMSMWVTISAKATQAAERAIAGTVQESQIRTIVSGLTSGWPEKQEEVFIGKKNFFSGLTTNQLHLESPSLEVVTIEIENLPDETKINYLAKQTAWTMRSVPVARAEFDYLGADGKWYEAWPPAINPEPGPFSDASLYLTPQLPLAVRLSITAETNTEILIADIASNPALPTRQIDILGTIFGDQ